MKKVFGVSKFKGLLLAGSFTVLANYFIRLSDSVVAGNMLGANALAGINLVTPVLAAISFFSGLVSTGMATCYSQEMGRCAPDRARQFAMQAFWTVLSVGGTIALTLFFARDRFVEYLGASAEISAFARSYLSWVWASVLPECMMGLLIMLGYADGDTKLCTLAYAANFVTNLVVAIVTVHFGMGAAGCAFATFAADLVGISLLCAHFFRKSNTFAPVRHFSLLDTWRIMCASFGDAAAFLCDGMLFFFLNVFTIGRFGSSMLPVVGVVTSIWGLLELFNGIGVAVQPIVTVYYGEGNTKSVRSVMCSAIGVAVVEGVLFMLFFGLFAPVVTSALGVEDPKLVAESAVAIRCLCGGFIALALAGLFNSYYMFVEKPFFAGLITFLCYFVMPALCIFVCSWGGLRGVWIGIGIGPFVGLLVTALAIVIKNGVAAFPLLLPRDREGKIHVFDLRLTPAEITETSRLVGEMPGVPMRAALMVEEVFMVVRDRNKGRDLLGEVTLDLNDGVQLTLRDDGDIFNITDADQEISSLRTFLVASVMGAHAGRVNLVTTGFNRNVFKF